MRDTVAQTMSERVSKFSSDLLLARGNTLRSNEDRLKLNELMDLCTTLQSRVLTLEKTKTTQALEIDSLKRRVKKLKKKAFKRVNAFVDYKTELVEESSKKAEAEVMEQESLKRAGIELEQESSKKQKIDDDKEKIELKQLVKIILDEEWVAIDVIPLAVKPPSIVDWKIHKEGKKSYYWIIRAGESLKLYFFSVICSKLFTEKMWKLCGN
nr:hypothetical protein [Tanacetum cinerariifolium]